MTSTTTPQKITSLDRLLSEKSAVETSCGTLYVRSERGFELWLLDDRDDEEMGRLLVQKFCGHVKDKKDLSGLQDQTVDKLSQLDISRLAQALAEQDRWEERPKIENFKEFGAAFRLQRDKQSKAHGERNLKEFEKLQHQTLESVKPFIPPRPEDTPMGRAMIQSAEKLQQIHALALKADSGAIDAVKIARKSLKIAIWTLVVAVVGVIVTVTPLLLPKSSGNDTSSSSVVQPLSAPAS